MDRELGGVVVGEMGVVGCAVEVEVDVVVDEPPVFVPSPDLLLVMSVIAVA